MRSSVGDPCVEQGEGAGIEGDHAFGGKFADGDFEPGAVRGEVDDAVELEVEELAGADAGGAQHGEAAAGEGVVELGDRVGEGPVGVGGEGSWEWFGESGQVGQEDETPLRCGRPSPLGDVFEEG